MKLIRKPAPVEAPPAPEPIAQAMDYSPSIEMLATVAVSTNEMLTNVSTVNKAIADKLQEVSKTESKPTSFRCKVVSRDYMGRIEAFDIEIKG